MFISWMLIMPSFKKILIVEQFKKITLMSIAVRDGSCFLLITIARYLLVFPS